MKKHKGIVVSVKEDYAVVSLPYIGQGCAGCELADACKPSRSSNITIAVPDGNILKPGDSVNVYEHRYTPLWSYVVILLMVIAGLFFPDSWEIAVIIVISVLLRIVFARKFVRVKWRIGE